MGGGSAGSTRSVGICAAQIKVKANNARQTFHLNNQRQWSVNSNEKGFYYATFRWQTKGVHMHTSYMYKRTHTHTIIRIPARVLSLAAIVHRINTHFKNTSSIRSVTRRGVRRVQDTFDTKVARGSLTRSLARCRPTSRENVLFNGNKPN